MINRLCAAILAPMLLLIMCAAPQAYAQSITSPYYVTLCYRVSGTTCTAVSSTSPLPVSGTLNIGTGGPSNYSLETGGNLATIASNTTGSATSANQATANGSLSIIATNTTGVATAANQATANTSLASIATNTGVGATAANQATANTSLSTIATNTAAAPSSVFSAQGLYTGGGGTALVSNTAIAVKGGAGAYFGIRTAKNTNATDCYVLVYNVASGSVTVGTTVPTLTIPVPAGGYWEEKDIKGENFSTAMSVAVVMTTPTGSTAPTTAFGFDLIYK